MRTIHFHKSLQKYTNNTSKITVDVVSYYDLIKASIDIFDDLHKLFKTINIYNNTELALIVDGKILSLENLFMPAKGKEIKLVPLIKGSGRIGMIVAAVAIIALAVFTGGITLAPVLGSVPFGTGTAVVGTTIAVSTFGQLAIGIATSLLLSALQPAPKPPKISSNTGGFRRDNDTFGSLTNTTNSQIPVSVNYGEMRVSGQLLSGFIKTIDHGKEDIIKVSDQFAA